MEHNYAHFEHFFHYWPFRKRFLQIIVQAKVLATISLQPQALDIILEFTLATMILPGKSITHWHEGDRIVAADLRRQFPGAIAETYQPGDILFREGSKSDTCFLLEQGTVEISKIVGKGKQLRLGLTQAGEYLGEISTLSGQPRGATATAQTKVQVVSFRRTDLVRLLRQQNPFATRLSLELCSLLSRRCLRLTRLVSRRTKPAGPAFGPKGVGANASATPVFYDRWAV